MTKLSLTSLLQKYQDIIKEEVNVKQVTEFAQDISITKIFKPLGGQLSAKFWKDTGKIIQLGKQGQIKELDEERICIFDDAGNEWILEKNEYEIAYEGLDSDDMAIDGNIIAKLDLELTPELQREGIAREISRFLNQMRKDANFNIDDRVDLWFVSDDRDLIAIMEEFKGFFMHEALIKGVTEQKTKLDGDIVALFENDGRTIEFGMKR